MGAEGKKAAAGPGSGSSGGLPLAPAARNGSRPGHYSDRHAERRRRSPPSRGGSPPAVPVTLFKLFCCVVFFFCLFVFFFKYIYIAF